MRAHPERAPDPSVRWQGLHRVPADGWPLDRVFVGVATLRTIRELWSRPRPPRRPWDVALYSGASPQGTADALERLLRLGLVRKHPSPYRDVAAAYEVLYDHPLAKPIGWLMNEERRMVRTWLRDRDREARGLPPVREP